MHYLVDIQIDHHDPLHQAARGGPQAARCKVDVIVRAPAAPLRMAASDWL